MGIIWFPYRCSLCLYILLYQIKYAKFNENRFKKIKIKSEEDFKK